MRKKYFFNILSLYVCIIKINLAAEETCDVKTFDCCLQQFFSTNETLTEIKVLSGGFSSTINVFVGTAEKAFVIKMYGPKHSQNAINREIYATKEAASLGIAPAIIAISSDHRSILMQWIEGQVLTPMLAMQKEHCISIAKALQKAHLIKKNPFLKSDFQQRIQRMYQETCQKLKNHDLLNEARDLFLQERTKIDECNAPKVMVHGDLNPHNLFVTAEGIQMIDWSETRFDDPFFDLTLFALFQGYGPEEENTLLEAYHGAPLSASILERYQRVKRANLASLCISCQWVMTCMPNFYESIDFAAEPKPWEYYTALFASRSEKITPQIFLEFSKAALVYAKKLEQ